MDIVLLDPSPTLAELLTWMLRYHGYQVTAAHIEGTAAAVGALEDAGVAVLRDPMPGRDEDRLHAIIAARRGRPTILLTLAPDVAATAAKFGVPAEDCLALPLSPTRLLARLAALCPLGRGT